MKSDVDRRAARPANARHKHETRWKILVGAVVLPKACTDLGAAWRFEKLLENAVMPDRELLED